METNDSAKEFDVNVQVPMYLKHIVPLLVIEVTLVFIICLAFSGVERAFRATYSFLFLFFLPGVPLFYMLHGDLLEKIVIINIFSICSVSVTYVLISYLLTPITGALLYLVPLLIFAFSAFFAHRKHFAVNSHNS